ncbi:MAG: hypothetical protein GY722_15310 [bacterium]|nr:hypothetical protein [bacterium]
MPDLVTPQSAADLALVHPTRWHPLVKRIPGEHHLAISTRQDPSNQLPGLDLTERLLPPHLASSPKTAAADDS